ncbi:MAG: hypothetical protein V4613_04505 [Bacteroidota bacterium]
MSKGIDTFCIDSQHIIVFCNPNQHAWLQYYVSELKAIEKSSPEDVESGKYRVVSVSGYWHVVYKENGVLEEECVDMNGATIRIVYGENSINYYQLKDNKVVKEWVYEK